MPEFNESLYNDFRKLWNNSPEHGTGPIFKYKIYIKISASNLLSIIANCNIFHDWVSLRPSESFFTTVSPLYTHLLPAWDKEPQQITTGITTNPAVSRPSECQAASEWKADEENSSFMTAIWWQPPNSGE